MARKKRKVGFYYLTLQGNGENVQERYNQIIEYIANLNRVQRNYNLTGEKFGLIDVIENFENNDRREIIFKSANHSYRPPLLSSLTLDERDSPKRIEEGDLHKTHMITKALNGDVIIILEKFQSSFTVQQIVNYLNHFCSQFEGDETFRFSHQIIMKDDFLDELNNLTRVTAAEIIVDKQLLGTAALDYSERTNSVKHDIVINVKAKNRNSIRDFATDTFSKLNGGRNEIRRIKVEGRNQENNVVTLNTDSFERQEFVNPLIDDDTGEIITDEIILEMRVIFHNL